jgi:hypothetical protein
LMHLNIRSLLLKPDNIKIWAMQMNLDILVLTETWISGAILDIEGYIVFRANIQVRGGGGPILHYKLGPTNWILVCLSVQGPSLLAE